MTSELYAPEQCEEMADEEAEQDPGPVQSLSETTGELRGRLEQLEEAVLGGSVGSSVQSSSEYCRRFCSTLLEFAGRWRIEEEPLPLVHVYIVALLSYAKASSYLSLQCENVSLVAERLSLSFLELLLSLKDIPDELWKRVKSSVQFAHETLEEHGITQLSLLSALGQSDGVWTNAVLQGLLSNEKLQTERVEEFLVQEGPVLLQMRVKQLMKEKHLEKAALLAKTCFECRVFQGKGAFKQMYLVCICATLEQDRLLDELSKEDCRDVLEMICNLDSEGDDSAALSVCSAFLTRQLLQGDTYCAWELTLLWSKLLKRLEPSDQAFLDRCHQMSLVSKSVYHILFLIKVIQSEIDHVGLPMCVEMCIKALRIKSDDEKTKGTVCKTISCLLPSDLEVKRACQLTEFLLEPTVDAYYSVETLYNEPDQKLEEESMPIPNSLRCELLLVLKTQWPFDPEFWDWKTLKRHCLALMGEEASIVSSIDSLNEPETPEEDEDCISLKDFNIPEHVDDSAYELHDTTDRKKKNREMKKLREKGFISTRFRNWQAYMQYCVLCDKEFLGHRIVRHAQTHLNNGIYSCPICAQTFTSRDMLIPHVTSHVKQSCKERLTAMKTSKSLIHPKTPHTAAFKAKTQTQLHRNNNSSWREEVVPVLPQVVRRDAVVSEDNMCPVGTCRRSFKFFKNLIAHVRGHGDNEEAKTFLELQTKKVVCQYCRRHFISVTHLNDHLQVHCGVRPYICIQLNCRASFLSNTELLIHKKTHSVFKARCMFPKCGKIFNAAFKLYDHEAHHYKTFTCKVVDCGKVFHSQQQLDLHLENHKTQEKNGPSPQQPGPSATEQTFSNPSRLKQEDSQQDEDRDDAVKTEHKVCSVSLHNLMKNPQRPLEILKRCHVKCEPLKMAIPAGPICSSNNSVIQSVQSLLLDPNRHREDFGGRSFDRLTPPQRNPSIEASLGSLLRGPPQLFPGSVNPEAVRYSSNCNVSLPVPQGQMSCRNMLTVSVPRVPTDSAASQPLPPTVTPQPLTRIKPVLSAPPPGQRERFHCAFGTCSRHYSSYRSATKHMKAAHPDFYEQWKVARTEIQITYVPARSTPAVGRVGSVSLPQNKLAERAPVQQDQRQNIIRSPPYANRTKSGNYPVVSLQSLPSLPHNTNASLLMANVLNPIVLSQLGGERNPAAAQSQGSGSKIWHSAAGNEQNPKCGSSLEFPPNQKVTSPSAAPPHGVSASSMMGSAVNTVESLQPHLHSRPRSIAPSCVNSAREVKSPPLCASSMESSLMSASKTPEESHGQLGLSSLEVNRNNKNNQPLFGPGISAGISPSQKQPRKDTRIKWPAIKKDGKFFCRRCFREFNSPKSLGGHLSKRAVCKPFLESDLNADLPQSFLGLLDPEERASQSRPSYSAAPVCHQGDEKPAGAYSTPNDLQDNLPAYENGESNDDILKQIMAESNMADLFVDPSVPQPLFPNACAPFALNEHLLGTSVIQHTEDVQLKQEGRVNSAARCPQQASHPFPVRKFPDPLLSQLLTEKPSTAVLACAQTNITTPEVTYSERYPSKTCHPKAETGSKPVIQTLPADGQLSQDGDCHRRTVETNIKKRLREQILAGDFQRRNNTWSSDAKASPRSSGTDSSPSTDSGFQQFYRDANNDSVIKGNSGMISGSSSNAEQLFNTESFTVLREAAAVLQDLPSPAAVSPSHPDPEPPEASDDQQQWFTEIQFAFERLNLIREKPEQFSTCVKESSCETNSQTPADSIAVPVTCFKPFVCGNENCSFSSISSDALWRHLSKTHNYTLEMINAVKKRYGQYAPFKCQKCPKAFTRNSNLRTHYRSAHKLLAEEIEALDMKRRLAKATASSAMRTRSPTTKRAPVTAVTGSCVDTGAPLNPQEAVKHQAFLLSNTAFNTSKSLGDNHCSVIRHLQNVPFHNLKMTPSAQHQTSTTGALSVQAGSSAGRWSQPQRNVPKMDTQQLPVVQDSSVTLQDKGPITGDEGPFNSQAGVKPNVDVTKKTKGRKPKSADDMSPYRPYRCVHQGCVAAFTIQHNLILHYRAVHQSALSALAVNEEQDGAEGADESLDCPEEEEEEPEEEFPQITEFRCQVKDCCCVFQEVPNLFLHYLQLHEFSLDKVGSLLSNVKLGRFVCGHQGCTKSFTSFTRYVDHVKDEHKDLKLVKPEQLHVSFRCEMEGCDRSYATKSNMLRHLMKKHQDLYQKQQKSHQVKDERTKQNSKSLHYQITKASNGKENIESNKKIPLKVSNPKRVNKPKNKHWLKYGKPSLKSKVEASAMCTKKFSLQYPCMIKACTSVMKSERNILKHYAGHGLSKKYLEQHRSHFIFCRKRPKQRSRSIRSDDSKSDNTSDCSDNEMTADADLEGEYESSKPVLRRRTPAGIPVTLFDSKVSTDESSDGSVVLKRKRGRPRKFTEKPVKQKKVLHATKRSPVYHREETVESSCPVIRDGAEQSTPLASFKPMGFEMSFLKFLEQSNKSEFSVMRPVTVTEGGKVQSSLNTKNTRIRFSNRQKLKSLGRVKIHLDSSFCGVREPMLKQLQDMRPAVVLEKY